MKKRRLKNEVIIRKPQDENPILLDEVINGMDLREDITVEPESKVYPHNKNEASAFLRDVAKCHIK